MSHDVLPECRLPVECTTSSVALMQRYRVQRDEERRDKNALKQ